MPLSTLAPAEELLPALLDLSVSGVVGYSPLLDEAGQLVDFAFAYLNPVAQRLLNLPAQPTNTYGQQFADAFVNGGFAFHRDAFLAGGEPRYLSGNYQAGQYDAFFRIGARRLGNLLLVSFITSDEQDRQEVEQALRASQAREQAARAEAEAQRQLFYDVLQHLPAQVATYTGPEHVFTFINSRFETFVPAPALLGRPVRAAGAVSEAVFALLDRVYATGEIVHANEVEVHLPPAQAGAATPLFVNASYYPLRDVNGNIYGVLDFSYDVTEQVLARRQVEQLNQELEARVRERTRQLSEQRQQLGQILAQVPAAIATLSGPEHRFSFASEIYCTIVGNRAAVGQPVTEAQPELVAQGFIELLDRVYTTGEPYLGREITVRLHDAATQTMHERYVDFSYQPLRDEQGRTTGILTFAVDETEKVLARQQVQALNQALAATNQALQVANEDLHGVNARLMRTNVDLDTFVYTASHDLKAPITNIEGLLTALRELLPAEVRDEAEVRQLLGLLQGAVERFQLTIEQLTDVSRLQQAQNLPAEQVHLSTVVEDVCLDLQPQLVAAGAQLTVAINPDIQVLFAPKNLRSVVYNLLSNAVKYRAADRVPTVNLHAAASQGTVVLTVQDNGLGLTEAQQRRLFGLFQRLHTHVEGTGVGLYMVKRMVENAGGAIEVASQPGQGTTFRVHFPA